MALAAGFAVARLIHALKCFKAGSYFAMAGAIGFARIVSDRARRRDGTFCLNRPETPAQLELYASTPAC